MTIETGLVLSYTAPMTFSPSMTGTPVFTTITVILSDTTGLISDVISYTTYLSSTIIVPTYTFTISHAPDWYAPALPRPVADVGWTFEQLQADVNAGRRYSIETWASFFGYIASLPFQMLKLLYQIVQFLGPLGLFLTWLLIMAPIVTWFKLLLFIKNLFISLLNFIIKVMTFVLDLFFNFVKILGSLIGL